MTCFPLRGKCRMQYVQANWIFRSEATLKSSETPFRAQRDGACQRSSNNVGYTVVLPPQPSGQLPRWGAKNVLPLNLTALPEGGKQVAATLILIAFVCRLQVLLIEIRNTKRLGDISVPVLHTASLLSAPLVQGRLAIRECDRLKNQHSRGRYFAFPSS